MLTRQLLEFAYVCASACALLFVVSACGAMFYYFTWVRPLQKLRPGESSEDFVQELCAEGVTREVAIAVYGWLQPGWRSMQPLPVRATDLIGPFLSWRFEEFEDAVSMICAELRVPIEYVDVNALSVRVARGMTVREFACEIEGARHNVLVH